ncbi:MAG: hypothetical protein B7Z58_18855 [Acidiphilium sp. 37-64-53]|nr:MULTISPECIES: DUF6878 family protein [Acidiphilium]OYV99078.1 MAG: hypothetical protein B7Z58_18855 [Acidiphilium sp. 37-64-53]OZB21115.1 MAG: hypothetical protein B7X49_18040 [Acidiphilium sp. 34-64-41]HQT86709.1 hypothetical protein [Acidiphilium rubrum]
MSDHSTTPTAEPASVATATALIADYTAAHTEFQKLQISILRKAKPILFGALKAAGINRVTVSFDGSGDSGQIESIEAYRAENQPIDLPAEPIPYPFATMEERYEPCSETPSGQRCAGYEVQEIEKSSLIQNIIKEIFWDFIGAKHDGWEDGEGGYGECVFDTEIETIRLEMNARYTETNYFEHEM